MADNDKDSKVVLLDILKVPDLLSGCSKPREVAGVGSGMEGESERGRRNTATGRPVLEWGDGEVAGGGEDEWGHPHTTAWYVNTSCPFCN